MTGTHDVGGDTGGGRETNDGREDPVDFDVAVVGGGPAGCSAAVFTGRYGLGTCVFDRGTSSLRRCAYLENYLGFPGGIDVDTFYGLIHDHAVEAGCEIVSELVTAVDRVCDPDRGRGSSRFVLETQEGRRVTATRVIAATRYDGAYLRPLDDGTMFETRERGEEAREYFDPSYADADGRTPVDGLYVAAPAGEPNVQAIVSAGHGALVARTLVEDSRRERGYPDPVAAYWDWLRRDGELAEADRRDHWREWFDERVPTGYSGGEDRLDRLREADVDRLSGAYRSEEAVERLTRRGYDRLLDRIGEERIRDYLDRSAGDEGATDGGARTDGTTAEATDEAAGTGDLDDVATGDAS